MLFKKQSAVGAQLAIDLAIAHYKSRSDEQKKAPGSGRLDAREFEQLCQATGLFAMLLRVAKSKGVPVEEIQRGIQHGVRKINVDTDNRLAITGAIRKVMMSSPEKFDPRDYLKPARAAMKQVCIDRMTAFGQAGNASKMRESATV